MEHAALTEGRRHQSLTLESRVCVSTSKCPVKGPCLSTGKRELNPHTQERTLSFSPRNPPRSPSGSPLVGEAVKQRSGSS